MKERPKSREETPKKGSDTASELAHRCSAYGLIRCAAQYGANCDRSFEGVCGGMATCFSYATRSWNAVAGATGWSPW
jgi:hypothetical protein